MTNDELNTFINRYFGSAVDAFTNARMKTVLLRMVTGGITDSFDNYAAFRAAILANRVEGNDWYMRARMRDTSYIYEYFPDTGTINWTASQQTDTI